MQPEDIDKLFRDQLLNHAPAPPTYLWAQLEAELQPAKKRPALWLYAAAAVVALLLVAGGGWLGQMPGSATLTGTLATTPTSAPAGKATPRTDRAEAAEKSSVAQATPTKAYPSNPTEANRAEQPVTVETPPAPETTARLAAHQANVASQPRAKAGTVANRAVARATVAPRRPLTADNQAAPVVPQALATTTTAHPERPVTLENGPEVLPKPETLALVTPAPAGTIEVEVRRGSPARTVALADAPDESDRQPKLVGRLLRKAGTAALREARENLPRVELPAVTVSVLNHSLSTKNIQL
ncbi:hypothetical protein GCM10022408_23340 [Hymenobacter fastidiosus]|uniref:Uncharacterized protein n=1 Tax=Hymenobacter fastidiosus TaxID=486264 RepID=A0ABP7SDP9_9BACT